MPKTMFSSEWLCMLQAMTLQHPSYTDGIMRSLTFHLVWRAEMDWADLRSHREMEFQIPFLPSQSWRRPTSLPHQGGRRARAFRVLLDGKTDSAWALNWGKPRSEER